MTAQDVLEILELLEGNGLRVWVDGGWGVDALLATRTRMHADLDIAVRSQDEPRLCELARLNGFVEVSAEPHNPVLEDGRGRRLDVHFVDMTVVKPNGEGRLVYGDIAYEVGAFEGTGTIAGRSVACCTAEFQVRSHTGYQLDQDDVHDVLALHRHFGIELPAEYRPFDLEGSRPPTQP